MFDFKTKLLIVDDMSTMRKLIGKCVKDLGFTTIEEAADGNLAWAALEKSNPPIGLVISDWNMPNCSGMDLLKRLRADARYKNLPFLMVTAEAEQHQVVEAIKAGVSNYIVKPFTPHALAEKLEQVHKKHSG
jgi:two-component system chemotaxis response regulator CheY